MTTSMEQHDLQSRKEPFITSRESEHDNIYKKANGKGNTTNLLQG